MSNGLVVPVVPVEGLLAITEPLLPDTESRFWFWLLLADVTDDVEQLPLGKGNDDEN